MKVRKLPPRVLFVCTGKSCRKGGSRKLIKAIWKLMPGKRKEIRVQETRCMGLCGKGPNVIVYPEGALYSGVTRAQLPELLGSPPKAEETENSE